MTVADWERIDTSAGPLPFKLRVCPKCSALVPDNDLAQQHHKDSHSGRAITNALNEYRDQTGIEPR